MGQQPINYQTVTAEKFRDHSESREPVFETRNVKDYQEKNHFNFGDESQAKMTTTWTHFSKRHVLAAQSKTRSLKVEV